MIRHPARLRAGLAAALVALAGIGACSAPQAGSPAGVPADARATALPGLERLVSRPPPLAACALRTGVIDRVVDGDTVRVFLDGSDGPPRSVSVRLLGIDAPERCQSGGDAATRFLSRQLPAGQRVTLANACQPDRYGRLLATLQAGGASINAALLDAGLAWHWTGSQPAGQPRGDAGYAAREAQAREQQRGVFADAQAQSPWEFRRTHGPC